MKITTLQDLYVHGLQDLYRAEKQLLEALPSLARAAQSQDLKAAFESHLLKAREHVNRLPRLSRSPSVRRLWRRESVSVSWNLQEPDRI